MLFARNIVAFCILFLVLVGSRPAESLDLNGWRKELGKHISTSFIYPRSAINRSIQGDAKVKVQLDRTGKIVSYEVVQETGQKVLDRTIPKMMKRMDPFPAPGQDVPEEVLTFVLPLTWKLD